MSSSFSSAPKGETDAEYGDRAKMLGCDSDGLIRLPSRHVRGDSPETDDERHDIRIVLMVDGEEVENTTFDCSSLVVSLKRQDADRVSVVVSRDDDGMPSNSLLRGGAGYKGAHTFVWMKTLITSPPGKAEKAWRLVHAVGWDPEISDKK